MDMSISTNDPNLISISLSGEFDAVASSEARESFAYIADSMSGDVTIDLSGVSFIDSSGVGALVFLFKRLSAQSRLLSLSAAVGQPADLLKMLRIDKAVRWLEAA